MAVPQTAVEGGSVRYPKRIYSGILKDYSPLDPLGTLTKNSPSQFNRLCYVVCEIILFIYERELFVTLFLMTFFFCNNVIMSHNNDNVSPS